MDNSNGVYTIVMKVRIDGNDNLLRLPIGARFKRWDHLEISGPF